MKERLPYLKNESKTYDLWSPNIKYKPKMEIKDKSQLSQANWIWGGVLENKSQIGELETSLRLFK